MRTAIGSRLLFSPLKVGPEARTGGVGHCAGRDGDLPGLRVLV
jgi:hypothetical protein